MNLKQLSSIVFSLMWGLVLSPFNSGALYLLFSIVIFGLFDYVFFGGKMEYNYVKYRSCVITYSLLGFIIGRTLCGLSVIHNGELHKVNSYKKIENIPCTILPLYNDIMFISKINKNNKVNLISKRSLSFFDDPVYYCYSYSLFPTTNDKLYEYINKTIVSFNECVKIYKKDQNINQHLIKMRYILKNSMYRLPLTNDNIKILIKSISNIKK